MSAAELAAWQAKAAAAGVSLSALLRQAMARTQTWTAPAREVERERTRQIARIGSNLNQIARWARAMLVKFLARGTGSAQAAADYLTRELDSQGKVRDDMAVLRGDPDQVAAVADALEFDHKYTSGVIAWAGLEPDRYAWGGGATWRPARASTSRRRAGSGQSDASDSQGPARLPTRPIRAG